MKNLMRLTMTILFGLLIPPALWPAPAWGIRLKEITSFEGVRPNQVQGYGLVVGLNGTGDKDKTVFTNQSLATMLRHMDVNINPTAVKVKNVAGVIVTAELPPFVKPGTMIDLVVSSLGDASSLQGGTLLTTQLMGVDGKVYVVAQGSLSVGGFAAGGQAGGNAQRPHPTVGRIVQGGTVEREVPVRWQGRETLSLKLGRPDFTTAARVAEAVNSRLPGAAARPLDSSTIEFNVPLNYRENMALMVAELENLEVEPDAIGQVVIDERTGTVVVGENVKISTVAVAHGNLSVQIKEGQTLSQPGPFAMGETPETETNAEEGADKLLLLERATTIHDLVKALNAIGASPRDLIMIFQAIRAAGALHGDLKFM